MNSQVTLTTLLAGIVIASSSTGHAQSGGSYDLKWNTIDGGGGTSTGGVYSVGGTIGQPDAGTHHGGNFTLQGGFWSLFSVVQTPGAPALRITHAGPHGAIVAWPAPSTNWVLQQTTTLAVPPASTVWTDVISPPDPPVIVIGSENTVTFNPAVGARYFRLRPR